MKPWFAVSALALVSASAGAQTVPAMFCADLDRVIAAARDTTPFASLPSDARLGPYGGCGVIRDQRPRFYCVMASSLSQPVDQAGLMTNLRQCLGTRLSERPVSRQGQEEFAVSGSGGVALVVNVTGCRGCRGGSRLNLFVYAPAR